MATPLRVDGADFSHHQGELNLLAAVQAGLKFAYLKVTEGGTVVDEDYERRRTDAAAFALPVGGYHFARPEGKDAKAEARFFFEKLDPREGDLCPALDLEVPGDWEQWARDFMLELERLLDERGLIGEPVHYGRDDFGKSYPYLRWVPRYNDSNTPPTVPWDIWQFSDGIWGSPKSFPGLGNVDLNTMRPGLKVSQFTLSKPVRRISRRLVQVTYNMGDGSERAKVADLVRLDTDEHPDVIYLEEVADRVKILVTFAREFGYDLIQGSGAGEAKVALLIRRRRTTKLLSKGIRRSVPGMFVGAGAGPDRAAPRITPFAEVEFVGRRLWFATVHAVPSVEGGSSGKAKAARLLNFARHMADLRKWALSRRGAKFLGGDFNATASSRLLRALARLGMKVASAASHGKRDIDQIWSSIRRWIKQVGPARALDGYSSDHKPVVVTHRIFARRGFKL